MTKLRVKNSGTEKFPFYQVFVNNREFCATDDPEKAKLLGKLLRNHFKENDQ